MTIFQASIEDLEQDWVRQLGEEFHSLSPMLGPFRHGRFVQTWRALLGAKLGGVFFFADRSGAIGGVISPNPSSWEWQCQEMFWFVSKEARGRGKALLDVFEGWAAARDCAQIIMVGLADLRPEILDRFYRRRGYLPVETHYVKRLKPWGSRQEPASSSQPLRAASANS